MTTATDTETRVRVEIRYDEFRGDWQGEADHLGTLVVADRRDASIHEQMRGVPCAVRVNVPPSYVDRGACDAILYVSPDKLRAEYGADNAETRATAARALEAEAREYRAHADGMTFGFVLTTETRCDRCGTWSKSGYDSVWGFTTDNPERDLLDWMGEHVDERGRLALADALDNWTGEYPNAAVGIA